MRRITLASCLVLLLFTMCNRKPREIISYHRFDKFTWYRHDNLVFNIPVDEIQKPYDILLFARHTRAYEFDDLDFGMIMQTPSGEERINEYNFRIKDKFNGFTGKCSGDSCEATIVLKRGIVFSQKGMLKVEIENLVPKMEVQELLGIGIKLTPVN